MKNTIGLVIPVAAPAGCDDRKIDDGAAELKRLRASGMIADCDQGLA
ncbi:MAG: hypothetical protein PHR30_03390 [Gallionellaceae bacterium]|nr:hypothetical protein [Gallionellaceae bacterium]